VIVESERIAKKEDRVSRFALLRDPDAQSQRDTQTDRIICLMHDTATTGLRTQ